MYGKLIPIPIGYAFHRNYKYRLVYICQCKSLYNCTAIMNSYTGLFLGVMFSLIVLAATRLLGRKLRINFPRLPVWRGVLWYRWKSLPSKEALEFSPFTGINFPYSLKVRARSAWIGFFLHLTFVFSMIVWAEIRYSNNRAHNCPNPAPPDWCSWTTVLELPHYIFLAGTGLFMLLHLLQTHLKYDGIAQDTAELCPIIGTVLTLVVLALMQQTERGLVFGYGLEGETFIALTNIARRFHPFVVAWNIMFTFWYHPMEGGWHHLPGFLPLFCILIQGCLLFTTAHLNPIWRVGLELMGFPHAIYVEYTHPDRCRWKMLLTGVLLTPLVVHFHQFNISVAVMATLFIGYISLVILLYRNMPMSQWTEPLHFPILIFSLIFVVYGLLYIPYRITNLFGIWPDTSVEGTIPTGFHPGVWICGVFLLFAIITLTFVLADISERLSRSYARAVGPMDKSVARVFALSAGSDSIQDEECSLLDNLPTVTMEEIPKHNKKTDAWLVIHGLVYDVTQFIDFHPGSRSILLEQCGKDATSAFNGINWGAGHPLGTIRSMKQLICAKIVIR